MYFLMRFWKKFNLCIREAVDRGSTANKLCESFGDIDEFHMSLFSNYSHFNHLLLLGYRGSHDVINILVFLHCAVG